MKRRPLPSSFLFRLAVLATLLPPASLARAQLDDDGPGPSGPARVIQGSGAASPDDTDDEDDKIVPERAPEAAPAPRAEPARPPAPASAPEPAAPEPSRPEPTEVVTPSPEPSPVVAPPAPATKLVRRTKRVKKCGKHHRHCRWVKIVVNVRVPLEAPSGGAGQAVETRRVIANPGSSGEGQGNDDVIPTSAHEDVTARPADAPEAPSSMSFDLVKESSGSAAEAATVERKVKIRRSMLQVHQAFGIATTALMLATAVSGQLNYSDRFGGGGSSGQFEIWHSSLEAATVLTFATTGLLALLAPVPFEKKSGGIDSVTIHKWSMLVATIGMGSEIPLGIYTVSREGYVNQGTMALTHLIIGYVTTAALATGVAALFF
ncbi:MAG: hypothetical protein ACYCWW_10015 [Deltaproteobacteria bacterium]